MKRRSFLLGTSLLALEGVVTGCTATPAFRIELLKDTVPILMVNRFRRQLEGQSALRFVPKTSLQALYGQLQGGDHSAGPGEPRQFPLNLIPRRQTATDPAGLVMIGDFWLTRAIQQELIRPLNPDELQQWDRLPQKWQNLVRRNRQGELAAGEDSQIWAAPYRWGTTAIAYRRDRFEELGWVPTDWGDLWREELRDRISLLNQPREIIGLTLKKLGYSYNTEDLSTVPNLKEELLKLQQNVRLYDSDTYLKPLILGDTWLALGWSTDISAPVRRQNDLGIAIPESGTALWSDLWVQPKAAPSTDDSVGREWIDFCWQPNIATQMSLLTGATSPIVWGMDRADLPPDLRNDPQLLPDAEILDRSEFLLPLPESTLKQYRDLWREIRQQLIIN
ncbi:MAG: extracellular solute-binding protein [Limnospira sp.]